MRNSGQDVLTCPKRTISLPFRTLTLRAIRRTVSGSGAFVITYIGYSAYRKMDRETEDERPLGERIRELSDQVTSLRKAIHEELDWREKSRAIDLDDWDEE